MMGSYTAVTRSVMAELVTDDDDNDDGDDEMFQTKVLEKPKTCFTFNNVIPRIVLSMR
jgi:hypothetical protein